MGQAFNGGLHRGILGGGGGKFSGGDSGEPTYPHHFECCSGRSGASLDFFVGRRYSMDGPVTKGDATPHQMFLRG